MTDSIREQIADALDMKPLYNKPEGPNQLIVGCSCDALAPERIERALRAAGLQAATATYPAPSMGIDITQAAEMEGLHAGIRALRSAK